MRVRRETVEHPFGTIKARMGATHFLMRRLHNVKTEMSLAVLAYNLTRAMNIIGIEPLIAAIREFCALMLAILPVRLLSELYQAPKVAYVLRYRKPAREALPTACNA